MIQHERFNDLFEAVRYLTENCGLEGQQATHYVWDNSYRMGTDRGTWLPLPASCKR